MDGIKVNDQTPERKLEGLNLDYTVMRTVLKRYMLKKQAVVTVIL